MSWFEEIKKTFFPDIVATIDTASHPALHKIIEDLCAKANVPMPEGGVHIIKESFGMPNAMFGKTLGGNAMFLGEKLLHTFGYEKEAGALPKELEAIIAHEIGHSTRIGKDVFRVYLPSLVMPIAAVAGYAIYQHAKKKHETHGASVIESIGASSKELEQGLHKAIDESALTDQHKEEAKQKAGLLSKVVRYAAVWIAGSLLAIPVAKYLGRKPEFLADAFAKEHVGAEHIISALQKLDSAGERAMTEYGMPKVLQKLLTFGDYHPSTQSRIANLRG